MDSTTDKDTHQGGSQGTVLIVDDEPALRRLVARWLTRAGFDVVEASDGVVAIDIARRQRLDAVVTDVRMPRMGGLELLELLLQLQPRLPVILVSASDEVPDAQAARSRGATDFLPKPVNLTQLLAVVQQAIDRKRNGAVAEVPSSAPRRRSGTILVVDDYDDARGTLREALEHAGHAVVEAANGQQALDYLVSHREPEVGLITLDLMMPVMDGFKFLDLLHNYVRLSTIPVLIVSSLAQKVSPTAHSAIVGRVQTPYRLHDVVKMVNGCVAPTTSAARS